MCAASLWRVGGGATARRLGRLLCGSAGGGNVCATLCHRRCAATGGGERRSRRQQRVVTSRTPRRKAYVKRTIDTTEVETAPGDGAAAAVGYFETPHRVKAVCTHDHYDLASVLRDDDITAAYKVQPILEDGKLIAVHMRPVADSGGDTPQTDKIVEAYLFDDGVAAFWSLSDHEIDRILLRLPAASHAHNDVFCYPYAVVESEADQVHYQLIDSGRRIAMHDSPQSTDYAGGSEDSSSKAITVSPNGILERFAVSHGLAVSVKLGVLESLVNCIAEEGGAGVPPLKNVTKGLQSGRVLLGGKQVLALMGELGTIRHEVNLRTDILSPDTYWARDDLERLYAASMEHFSVDRRIRTINNKVDYCEGMLECIDNHLAHRTSVRLEWLIVILIAVEVIFEVVNFTEKKQRSMKRD